MVRTRQTVVDAAPGAGTLFVLRAIGIVFLARWLYSMSEVGYATVLNGIASSPWACINLIFLFLLVVLPGAQAKAEKPFHPLPRWLRQALRLLSLLACLFAFWSVGVFLSEVGVKRLIDAIAATNGWIVVAPALYLVVLWVCRPRALGRTNVAAGRFALGRYTVAVNAAARTATVWQESRKVGQYSVGELALRWADPASQGQQPGRDASAGAGPRSESALYRLLHHWTRLPGTGAGIELLWNSPAAAGHNRQLVFRLPLRGDAERATAQALDTLLQQSRTDLSAGVVPL